MEVSPAITMEHDQLKTDGVQRRTRRPPILVFTGFRALACLWVFLSHRSYDMTQEFKIPPMQWLGVVGPAAVTLFFSLSGFIMVWVYGDCAFESKTCYWSFVGRRVARLFPLYYLSLTLAIYDVRCLWDTGTSCTLLDWTNLILTVLGIRTWFPYHFTNFEWSGITWSVQTELFFYLAFPFLLCFIRYLLNINRISLLLIESSNRNPTKRLYSLWLFVLCVSAVPLIIRLLIHDNPALSNWSQQATIIYFSPFTRIPEFILGMLTGIIFILKSSNSDNNTQSNVDSTTALIPSREQQQRNALAPLISYSNYEWHYLAVDIYFTCQVLFFTIIRSPFLFKFNGEHTKYDAIVCQGPLPTLIMCSNLYLYPKYASSLTSKVLRTSILMNMGNISYAFYCTVEALPKLSLLISGVAENSPIMMLSAGIGMAVFGHHYIETPIYNWAHKKLPKCQCV